MFATLSSIGRSGGMRVKKIVAIGNDRDGGSAQFSANSSNAHVFALQGSWVGDGHGRVGARLSAMRSVGMNVGASP